MNFSTCLYTITVHIPFGPYALLVFSSIFLLSGTSSYAGPAGAVGPTLACPSFIGEYTALLRIHKYVIKVPMNIPKTKDRKELIITLIITVA